MTEAMNPLADWLRGWRQDVDVGREGNRNLNFRSMNFPEGQWSH
jgi:hypothetical protein